MVAKVEWHPGASCIGVGFVVTNCPGRKSGSSPLQTERGTAEDNTSGEGKNAEVAVGRVPILFDAGPTRLASSCHAWPTMGNFMRTLALPDPVSNWSLHTLRERAGENCGAEVARHGRYVTFQLRPRSRSIWLDLFAASWIGSTACDHGRHQREPTHRQSRKALGVVEILCPAKRYEIGTGPWVSDRAARCPGRSGPFPNPRPSLRLHPSDQGNLNCQ